jgi:hypothetical protein
MGTMTDVVEQVTTNLNDPGIITGTSTFWNLGCEAGSCGVLSSRLSRNHCSKRNNDERFWDMHGLFKAGWA